MAATITCTPGGSADNCYVTAAQATAYYAGTLREATWAEFPADDRAKALIQATQDIERQGGACAPDSPSRSRFWGEPYDVGTPQALHFPRSDDLDSGGSVVIPEAVRDAVCEQALWLLQQQAAPELLDYTALHARGVTSLSADGLAVSLGKPGAPDDIAPRAWVCLRPYVRRTFRLE
jgi:hypothetical protein